MLNLTHKDFDNLAQIELKRAERYANFLSLIVIDLKKLVRDYSKQLSKNSGVWEKELNHLVCQSVRQTDLVSGIQNHKLALLLTETPRSGAQVLASRLSESLKIFLNTAFNITLPQRLSLEIVSFPDKNTGKEKFLGTLQSLAKV